MSTISETPENSVDDTITFNGIDIRELSRDDLIEALRVAFPELVALRNRLSDEGRMTEAREEDFQRELRGRRDFLGNAAEYQSRIFDASTAYNQLIVIGGYAAFFGVWAGFSKDLNRTVILLSGCLVLASLVVYITWTVIGMYQLGRRNIEAAATFGAGIEGFVERFQATEVAAQQRSASLLKFWPPVVWASGLTGFAAAILLGNAALLAMMSKSELSQQDPIIKALQRTEQAAVISECNSRVAALYAQTRNRPDSTATNPKTGERAVLVKDNWVILPNC